MSEIKINLGCGIYCKKGWINVDKYLNEKELRRAEGKYKKAFFEEGAKFIQADILELPFSNNYADWIESHEVLEHMAITEILPACKEIYRVLKPGGTFICTSPSFDGLAIDWLRMTTFPEFNLERYVGISQTIYGNQAHDGEYHRCPLNMQFLDFCLGQSGFREGYVAVYRKGIKTPQFGRFSIPRSISKLPKNTTLRNDTLYAEVKK